MLTRNNTIVAAIATLILLICLGACAPKHSSYSDFKEIPETGWSKSAPYYFTPEYNDSTATYNLSISIRHDNYYQYRNLWLFVDYFATNDSVAHRDTINCEIADKFGNWHSAGFGTAYQYEHLLKSSFSPNDISHIVVWQGMRVDTIKHISDIGITVKPNRE